MPVRVRSRARRRLVYATTALLLAASTGVGAPAAVSAHVPAHAATSVWAAPSSDVLARADLTARLPSGGIDGWFDDPESVRELPPLPEAEATDEPPASEPQESTAEDDPGGTLLPWIPGFAIALAVGLLVAGAVGLLLATRRPVPSD